jgi:hypothetical protein
MNTTKYTYENAEFEIAYDVIKCDDPRKEWVSIWSITHNNVEFFDILSKDLIAFLEEKLDKKMLGD